MTTAARVALALGLVLVSALAQAAPVSVLNLRLSRTPDYTRLVFGLSAPAGHHLFTLTHPDRVVVDLPHARLAAPLPTIPSGDPYVKDVRTGEHRDGDLRIVIDVKTQVEPRTYLLPPDGRYGNRLVIDLYGPKAAAASPTLVVAAAPPPPAPPRDLIIAIDPGHGGADPGAIGRVYHTEEKNVTLAIGRDLAREVDATPGLHALMTRTGDYYVSLGDRVRIARDGHADIFISIHADSMPGPYGVDARGASVYALSQRGASDAAAKFLADRENASDWIGGVNLADKDSLLREVLVNLSQTATIRDSLSLGQSILDQLGRFEPLHRDSVGQAAFAVLKAPDIPSVLVETAYLSDPAEERLLRQPGYQRRIAAGILAGLKNFLKHHPMKPQPAVIAADRTQAPGPPPRVHVVRAGETLSGIARRYDVQVEALRFVNDLSGNELRVGTALRIP